MALCPTILCPGEIGVEWIVIMSVLGVPASSSFQLLKIKT